MAKEPDQVWERGNKSHYYQKEKYGYSFHARDRNNFSPTGTPLFWKVDMGPYSYAPSAKAARENFKTIRQRAAAHEKPL